MGLCQVVKQLKSESGQEIFLQLSFLVEIRRNTFEFENFPQLLAQRSFVELLGLRWASCIIPDSVSRRLVLFCSYLSFIIVLHTFPSYLAFCGSVGFMHHSTISIEDARIMGLFRAAASYQNILN